MTDWELTRETVINFATWYMDERDGDRSEASIRADVIEALSGYGMAHVTIPLGRSVTLTETPSGTLATMQEVEWRRITDELQELRTREGARQETDTVVTMPIANWNAYASELEQLRSRIRELTADKQGDKGV